ncbi:MAG TPA: hypothetical protein VFH66_00910 [Mycobacteriales bacterium]|nr:hypothetical protein [Mycobacteriales bacterium]
MDSGTERAGMLSGAAFAILLFVGINLMLGSEPNTSSKDSAATIANKWVAVLQSSSHRSKILVGAFLVMFAALALIWFANTLRNRYALTGTPIMAFATLAAIGVAASVVGPLVLVGGHTFGNEALPTDGNVLWAVGNMTMPLLLVVYGFGLAAMLATFAFAARAALPRWLLVFTWIVAVASLASVEFFPMLLALVYLLVVGIWGGVRQTAAPRVASTTAPAAA